MNRAMLKIQRTPVSGHRLVIGGRVLMVAQFRPKQRQQITVVF